MDRKLKKIKRQKIQNQEVSSNVPVSQKPVFMPRVKDPTYNYNSTFDGVRRSRTEFKPPEYNLAEVGRVSDVDGYVARSFEKKLSLMFKEGWSLIGKNPKTVDYIKIRLKQIANASNIPTKEFFRKIGDGLVRKSNSFIVKVRNEKSSGGSVRKVPGKNIKLKPVAGYFVPPAETMEFRVSRNSIDRWRQSMPYGQQKEFSIEDTEHFYYNRKDGFVFGTPTIVPVIDDVRALRKIEENIELLIYQHLFPLFQWKVGTKEAPATITEDGKPEVDIVRQEIQYLPTEGGIVTTERHEINAIGSEGRALRAEGYLTHFKRRVFSGLDMSPIDFGESDSSNRSTAQQLSQNLIDRVKDFQRVMESFVDEHIIKELLLESTFGPSVLDEENTVHFKFKEIDLELQIKKENHYADLFAKNTIGLNESRLGIDKEAITIPTPEEIDDGQDGPEKYPEWYEFYWNLIEKPKALIQSVDEAYLNATAAKTAAAAQETKTAELDIKRKQVEKSAKPVKNAVLRDLFLSNRYIKTKSQIVEYISKKKENNIDFITQLIRTALSPAIDKMGAEQAILYKKGYAQFAPTNTKRYIEDVDKARNRFKERSTLYIEKLVRDISVAIVRNIKPEDKDISSTVESVFDSFKFRSEFIEDVEVRKSFSFGRAKGMNAVGIKQSQIYDVNESCDLCVQHSGLILDNTYILLSDVSPFHSSCECKLKSYIDNTNINDNVDEVLDYNNIEDKRKGSAEKAARKARMNNCIQRMIPILKRDNPTLDNRDLKALAEVVCVGRLNDGIEDGTKLERCVLQVKKSLRKQHPDWNEKKIKSTAFAICNDRIKE